MHKTKKGCQLCKWYIPPFIDYFDHDHDPPSCYHPTAKRYAGLRSFPFKRMCKYGETEKVSENEA